MNASNLYAAGPLSLPAGMVTGREAGNSSGMGGELRENRPTAHLITSMGTPLAPSGGSCLLPSFAWTRRAPAAQLSILFPALEVQKVRAAVSAISVGGGRWCRDAWAAP